MKPFTKNKSLEPAIPKKKGKPLSTYWQLYVLLALPLIWLAVFCYYPMTGIQIAFKDYRAADGIWGSEWIGFENFIKFFESYQFERILANTLIVSFYSVLASFPISIVLALCINSVRSTKFKKFVQTTLYMPHFISVVVLVGMVIQILNPRLGLYGQIASFFTGSQPEDILGMPQAFSHIFVWSGIWQNMGWNTIIYIAALSATDIQLHEAAEIDGATRFQRMIHIDFPSILPTATIMLILNAGRIMSVGFEKVYLLQNDLNLRSSEIISTYVYKVSLGAGIPDFSYATAIGLFNSLVNLALIIIVNAISKRASESSLW